MDEQLQAKIEEAKAAGYSDEEIQQYLSSKGQPLPEEKPIDRSGEYGAVAQQVGASFVGNVPELASKAAEYVIPAAVGARVLRGPVAPTQAAPTQGTQAAQQATGTYGSKPNLTVQQGGVKPIAPGAQAFDQMSEHLTKTPGALSSAQSIVQKLALDKVLKGAGIAAGAYQLGQGLFGTSPEEIAIMKEAEAKKRAQGWKPLNER